MKPEILITAPIYPGTMDQLHEAFTAHHLWEANDEASFLAPLKDRVTGIVTKGEVGAKAKLMDALPKAKIISCFAVGVDAVDLQAAKERGIAVTNTPDVLTDCVADLGIALVLASARQVAKADRFVRAGRWAKGEEFPYGQKIGGRTLGILGLGRIGKAIARRAEAFNLHIVYHGPRGKPEVPYRHFTDLAEMARICDFLVVSSPGGAATRHLVDARVLEALGRKGTLVNVARGSVVDEKALVEALQKGTLGAAALDVFADEPRVPEALFGMENVILQPHQGSLTHETRAAMGQLVVDNLKAHFAGQPLLTRVV